MAETMSDVFEMGDGQRAKVGIPVLHVVLRGGAPYEDPSSHSLADVDVVTFARGERAATRFRRDGQRYLALSIPDPMMSSDHGRLLNAEPRWFLDDPASKNGAIVGGKRARSAALVRGRAFALGHTVFVLDEQLAAAGDARDVVAGALTPPVPVLASFHPELQAASALVARLAPTALPLVVLGETLPAQAALLRALQQREVVPVGDSAPIRVDFRLCAATHRDLDAMVAAGTFRQDLHARLLGATVRLPPLRERRADLGLLVRALLAQLPGGRGARLTPAAALALVEHGWPNNVRELERTLAVAVTLAGGDAIDLAHLPSLAPADEPPPAAAVELTPDDQALRSELVERLAANGGNVAEVARQMGKDRTQLYRWLRRFGIERER